MSMYSEDHIRNALDRMVQQRTAKPKPTVSRDILRVASTGKPHFKAQQIAAIYDIVSSLTSVSIPDLKGRRRAAVRARHMVYYLARNLTPFSLLTLADIFDRDHSSVLHGIRKVTKNRQDYEPELTLALNALSSWRVAA